MIFELLAGASVSLVVVAIVKACDFGTSIRNWVLSISRFVYHSGHPLWDDDERFQQVSKEYKAVAFAFIGFLTKLILVVAAAFVVIAASSMLSDALRGSTATGDGGMASTFLPAYLLHWPFLVGTLIPLAFLPFLPTKTSADPAPPYSVFDQFLHYVFLGNQSIAKGLLRIECFLRRRLLKEAEPKAHIYVSGLARSGSTSLMQYLAQLPGYKSLSYRNMPFIFMPKTGTRLVSGDAGKEQERAHKDGMKHGLDTQEALEEPFWLHYCGTEYVKEDRLVRHAVSSDIHAKYRKFRALVAENETYLAKNNNHLLRASSVHELDAAEGLFTRTVIPFREPWSQAKSLLRQHLNLSEMQSSDSFVLDYMDFLGHHEFGLHAKSPAVEDEGHPAVLPDQDPLSIEFWLDVWHLFYERVFEIYRDNPEFCFFCYEKYVQDPKHSLEKLVAFLQVSQEALRSMTVNEWRRESMPSEGEAGEKYRNLYSNMVKASING